MIRFNRLLPVFNSRIQAKFNKNSNAKNFVVNNLTIKTDLPLRHISITTKFLDKNNDLVSFNEFKNLTKIESSYIIDVREPEELKETGVIPGSINVPCK